MYDMYCTAHASSYVTSYKYLSVRGKQHHYYRLPGYVRMVKSVTGGQTKRSEKLIFGSELDIIDF